MQICTLYVLPIVTLTIYCSAFVKKSALGRNLEKNILANLNGYLSVASGVDSIVPAQIVPISCNM